MPPVIVRYRKILAINLANNAILFTESAIIGHRVQIKMSVDDLNRYFIWKRQSGSSRPVGHFLSDVSGVPFQEVLLDSLNKSYVDLDGMTSGLNFSSYIFDANSDGRTRESGQVSVNDLAMAYILYKCYGSSACPTASVIYNLEDAQAMLTSGGVSMSIVGAFNDDEAAASAADAASINGCHGGDYGGVDAMFRNMLATVPLRYFQANGTQIPGLFETNYSSSPSDPAAQGSWKFLENDRLELRVQFNFQQPVAHKSIDEVGKVCETTVINAGDSFTIRLQILATDTPSGAAAKAAAAAVAIHAASQETLEAQQAAATAAMIAAAEAQQAVNAAALQQQADTDQYFSILSRHAQQEIYTLNSETIYKNATAAMFAAIQYNGPDCIIQTARATALNAAANYAQSQAILANLSTKMLEYKAAQNSAISTLGGAQIIAAARLLASATAANVTAQVALATAQSNASMIALSTNTCYSTIMLNTQLQAATNPNILLTNQINLTASSNATQASLSNFLIAQANQITALNTLNSAQAILNNAIILGKPLGIVSGNLNAAVVAESRTKSVLLSTNIAFITAVGAESAALNTLLFNKYTAANLSNLLALQSYNAASSNVSTATASLSNVIAANSTMQATLSLENANLTSTMTGGGSAGAGTSTILGYTAAANSTATAVTMNSSALVGKQVLLNAANSNVLATSANLSSVMLSNDTMISTFSTTMSRYNNITISTTTYAAASAINTAHINYNIALEAKAAAQSALTVAQTILNTAVSTATPQEIALLEIKVAATQAVFTSASIAFNEASTIYTSTATSITENPNSFAILSAAAAQLMSSISTATNTKLANNLYAALSTQNSLTIVLNGYSIDAQMASVALNKAITSGADISEIKNLNARFVEATAASAAAATAVSAAANSISVAKAAAAGDPNVVGILESVALLSYSTAQATIAVAAVQQVAATYEDTALALQSSLVAQLAYSTAVNNLYNGIANGFNIQQITPLQQAVNLQAYLYGQATGVAINTGRALVNQEAIASVNPTVKAIIDTTAVNLNATAISNSVNGYASTLIAAKGAATSSLVAMTVAQSAYDVATVKLDTEITSGISITQIQAAQVAVVSTATVLANATLTYNTSVALVENTTTNLTSSTAAYTSTLALANQDPLAQAIIQVVAETASLATSLSTQVAAIASAEVVSLASIAYDAQSTLATATGSTVARATAALSTAQSAVLNYTVPAYVLTAIANFASPSSLQMPPSVPVLTATIGATSFDIIVYSIGASSYSFTLDGTAANPTIVGTRATFSGLAPKTYTVGVVASNSVGSSSATASLTIVSIPVPTAITVAVSSITTSGFTVGWTGGLGAVSTFYTLGSTFTQTPSNPFTLTGLTQSTQYILSLSASNLGGTTYSLPTTVRTLTELVPPPITNIITSLITATGFSVSWSSAATSYSFVLNGASYTPSTDNSASQNISLTGLTELTPYLLVITASNAAGYTTAPVRVTTTAAPPPPVQVTPLTDLVVSDFTPTGFTVTWSGGDLSTFYTYKINGVTTVPAVDNGVMSKTATFTGIVGTAIVVVTAENPDDSESSMPVVVTIPPQIITMANNTNVSLTGIAFDLAGENIYTVDQQNSNILKTSYTTFSTTTYYSANFSLFSLCFDASSNLYVTGSANNNIIKITDGSGTSFLNNVARGITIGTDGYMYTTQIITGDVDTSVIIKADINGNTKQITPSFADNSTLRAVISLCMGPDGYLYLADSENGRIVKMSMTGEATTFAYFTWPEGRDYGSQPYGLTCDASGNLYVMDYTSYVHKVTSQGVITTIAGNGSSDDIDGPLLYASVSALSLCIGPDGNLWFPQVQGKIRKIEMSPPLVAAPVNAFTGVFPPFNLSIEPFAGGFSVGYSDLFYKDPFYPSQANQIAYGQDASGNPLYVAVGIRFVGSTAITIATSTDGALWTPRKSPFNAGMCQATSVAYGNGIWVATGTTSEPIVIVTSTDGINWYPLPVDPFALGTARVQYINGVFYATGRSDNANICTSTDGINWTPIILFPGGLVSSLAYGDGLWVAVGNNIDYTESIATSSDLINWTPVSSPFTGQSAMDVAFGQSNGNPLWIAVGSTPNMATSTDGITWTPETHAFASDLYGILYANGLWIAYGSSTTTSIVTSSDGITWNPITNPLRICSKIIYANNTWYATGYSNDSITFFSLLRSTDTITWTPTYNNPGTISYTFLIDNVPTTPSTDVDGIATFNVSGSHTLRIIVGFNNNTVGTYSVSVN